MSQTENHFVIQIDDDTKSAKDRRTRTRHFANWLDDTGQHWTKPDLDAYRDYLKQQGKTNTTVASYIGTIRSRYQDITSGKHLDAVLEQVKQHFGTTYSPDVVRQQIDPNRLRQQGQIDVEKQPTYEGLSRADVVTLFEQVDTQSRQGSRDLAILGLMLCTGATVDEIVMLQVKHIDFPGGTLHIPEAPGGVKRTVKIREDLFFAQPWLVDHLREHLHLMEIWQQSEAFLFQSFWRGGNAVRSTQLTLRGANNLLQSYTLTNPSGETGSVTGMHFRHTFVRALYEGPKSLPRIRDVLGVKQIETARRNVGLPDPRLDWRGELIQSEDVPEMEVK
jgi:site-specific recombinase XerD